MYSIKNAVSCLLALVALAATAPAHAGGPQHDTYAFRDKNSIRREMRDVLPKLGTKTPVHTAWTPKLTPSSNGGGGGGGGAMGGVAQSTTQLPNALFHHRGELQVYQVKLPSGKAPVYAMIGMHNNGRAYGPAKRYVAFVTPDTSTKMGYRVLASAHGYPKRPGSTSRQPRLYTAGQTRLQRSQRDVAQQLLGQLSHQLHSRSQMSGQQATIDQLAQTLLPGSLFQAGLQPSGIWHGTDPISPLLK